MFESSKTQTTEHMHISRLLLRLLLLMSRRGHNVHFLEEAEEMEKWFCCVITAFCFQREDVKMMKKRMTRSGKMKFVEILLKNRHTWNFKDTIDFLKNLNDLSYTCNTQAHTHTLFRIRTQIVR